MPFNFNSILGIKVVLEKKQSHQVVGELIQKDGLFRFEYDRKYLALPRVIPLGPEMPLTRKVYESKQLFRPFSERIPSRENPAYPDYCRSAGISENENNPLVLLSTIGSRGPSSFLFKPLYDESFDHHDLRRFRQSLGLTVREFACCFDLSYVGVIRVEGGSGGREILKRVEIYASYSQVALDQLRRREPCLHYKKFDKARNFLTQNCPK